MLLLLCLVAQSCPTLCDPIDCSPTDSSVHGDSPGKNIGVGRLSLLQGNFQTQESNQGLLHCRWILYHLSYPGSPPSVATLRKIKKCSFLFVRRKKEVMSLRHFSPFVLKLQRIQMLKTTTHLFHDYWFSVARTNQYRSAATSCFQQLFLHLLLIWQRKALLCDSGMSCSSVLLSHLALLHAVFLSASLRPCTSPVSPMERL